MELKNYTLNFGSEGSFKIEGSFPKFLYNVGFFGENRLAGIGFAPLESLVTLFLL